MTEKKYFIDLFNGIYVISYFKLKVVRIILSMHLVVREVQMLCDRWYRLLKSDYYQWNAQRHDCVNTNEYNANYLTGYEK
jgi:hypothetical protein